MKTSKGLVAMAICLVLASPAFAGSYSDAFVRCLANSTTGKDRIDLARWLFASISLHPEIAPMANISPKERDSINSTVGLLYKRLLAEDCKSELQDSLKHEGREATQAGFRALGKLAMQELMSEPKVIEGLTAPARYVDFNKLMTDSEPDSPPAGTP